MRSVTLAATPPDMRIFDNCDPARTKLARPTPKFTFIAEASSRTKWAPTRAQTWRERPRGTCLRAGPAGPRQRAH